MKGTAIAPDPLVWVCGACGKRARSRYGFDAQERSTAIDRGWDESCMLHAVLCTPNPAHETDPSAPKWLAVEK